MVATDMLIMNVPTNFRFFWKPILLNLIFVLTSCGDGDGSGGATGVDSNNLNKVSVLYDPATYCKLERISDNVTNYSTTSNDCGHELSNNTKSLVHLKINNPISTFDENKFYFMSDITPVIQGNIKAALVLAADLLGYFPTQYYGLGGKANETDYFNNIKPKICAAQGIRVCDSAALSDINNIVENKVSNAGANPLGFGVSDTVPAKGYLIYQGLTKPNPENITLHEYFHVFQHAAMFGISDENNIRRSPSWFTESSAQYFAEWLGRANSMAFSEDTFKVDMANKYNEAVGLVGSNPLDDNGSEAAVDLWAIAYMIELAEERSDLTEGQGPQAILITMTNQMVEKGWQKAFLDNVGISVDTFYSQFNDSLTTPNKATRMAKLNDDAIETIIKTKYNYSILQYVGADTTSKNAATPSAKRRTVYYYTPDSTEVPSWNFDYNWPYVRNPIGTAITKDSVITADISISNAEYVLIKQASGSAKPVYQYASDTLGTKAGSNLTNWNAIRFDGVAIDPAIISD